VATELKKMQVDVPGLTSAGVSDGTLFALGGGVDLDQARKVGNQFADGLARFGAACNELEWVEDARELRETLAQPLPDWVDQLGGVLVAVLDAKMTSAGPSGVEAFAIVSARDPKALLDVALKAMPGQPQVPADGEFHDLVPAGTVPGLDAIRVAIKPNAIAFVTGAKGTQAATFSLGQTGTSPLFFMSYDYGRLMKLGAQAMGPMAGLMPGMSQKMSELFGQATMAIYTSDQGLTMSLDMEMR